MKNLVRNLLQKLLGFKNYLFIFSLYSIKRIEKGKYEGEFLHFIKMIKDEGIILDIGANIGITAAPLAKHFPNAQIHAFEPISENFITLEKIRKFLNLPNIHLFNLALGNGKGILKMIMPILGNSRMQGLSKAFEEGSNEKGIQYEVPLRRLDDLYPTENKIKAIKIDVENFEYEVFCGAKTLLERNKPIIYCELWDNEVRVLVLELLKEVGYKSYIFNYPSNILEEYANNSGELSNNFFFIAT